MKKRVKKHKAPRRLKEVSLSAAKKAVRKRRRVKKGGQLSEMLSPERAKMSASALISGAVGGAAINAASVLIPKKWGNGARVVTNLSLSFITGVVLNMPNVSAGMAGATAFEMLNKKFLGESEEDMETMEETDFVNEDLLEEMPLYLDENGTELMEDDGGNLVSLAEKNYIQLQDETPEYLDTNIQYYAPYNQQY